MTQTENINISLTQPLMQELPQEVRLSRFSFLSLREYPIHTHLHMEVIYVVEGSLSVKVGVSSYTLSAGEFTIINPFELHALYCTDESNRICLLEISPRFYDPCREGTIFVSAYKLYKDAAKEDFSKLEEVLQKIFQLHLSAMLAEESLDGYLPVYSDAVNEEYEKILLRTLINYFELHFTAEYFLLSDHRENTLRDSVVQAQRLKNILSYFYENFPRKIQLQDVADHTYVNRYHISHLVKSGIGYTFSELLQHIRIEKAEIYLLGTELPISRIVFELGFSSYRYFNQHFKNLFHMTPNAYRQKYQKETVRYKEISVLEPLPRSAAKGILLRRSRLQTGESVGKPPEKKTCFLDLKALIQQVEEAPSGFGGRSASSDLTWPKTHVLYDAPYMAALLLSQMSLEGPSRFLKNHPCFSDASSEDSELFTGKPGPVCCGGLRKASFYALAFLEQFPQDRCLTGPGYFFAREGVDADSDPEAQTLRLLLYYTPFDAGELLSRRFPAPKDLIAYVDRRTDAMSPMTFAVDLHGGFVKTAWRQSLKLPLDPFLQWQRMGCPSVLNQKTTELLNDAFRPGAYFFDAQNPLEIELAPFEVTLFTFML